MLGRIAAVLVDVSSLAGLFILCTGGVRTRHNPLLGDLNLTAYGPFFLPLALCLVFGAWTGRRREARALLVAMLVLFVPLVALTSWAEDRATPAFDRPEVASATGEGVVGGNLEGKETRFGVGG